MTKITRKTRSILYYGQDDPWLGHFLEALSGKNNKSVSLYSARNAEDLAHLLATRYFDMILLDDTAEGALTDARDAACRIRDKIVGAPIMLLVEDGADGTCCGHRRKMPCCTQIAKSSSFLLLIDIMESLAESTRIILRISELIDDNDSHDQHTSRHRAWIRRCLENTIMALQTPQLDLLGEGDATTLSVAPKHANKNA